MRVSAAKRPKRLRRPTSRTYALSGAIFLIALSVSLLTLRPNRVESNPVPTTKVATDHDTILLPVPQRMIAQGEKLGSVSFDTVKWPKSNLSANYLRDLNRYPNAVALTSLPDHMPIPLDSVALIPVDSNAVVERIPRGLRAITVRVDAESAVEGWARSGSFVDVIVIQQSQNRDVGLEAKVIAENVRILSAGRSTEPLVGQASAPRAPATVTLLVSQEDALKIKLASGIGKLTFALRGGSDSDPTHSVSVNQKAMLGGARTFIPKKVSYRGRAKGPDGRVYFLGEDSRWVPTAEREAARASLSRNEGTEHGSSSSADEEGELK